MDRNGISENQFVQVAVVIRDVDAVDVNVDLLLFRVDFGYEAHVAVEDVLIVVVPDLHDTVADAELPAAALQLIPVRVQGFLQLFIERMRTGKAR